MRVIAIFLLLLTTVSCSNERSASSVFLKEDALQVGATPAIVTGTELVDRIGEITQLPQRKVKYNNQNVESVSWTCGDSLFWKIAALGKDAIPYLIEKIKDSTQTNIVIPCSESKLTVGTIAFVILDKIIGIPGFLVFHRQFDCFTNDCNFGYAHGELEYIGGFPTDAHDKLLAWYKEYGSRIKEKVLKPADQNDCQRQFGIDTVLSIEY